MSPADGKIQYSEYSDAELLEAWKSIDRSRFPENWSSLSRECSERDIDPSNIQDSLPQDPSRDSGAFVIVGLLVFVGAYSFSTWLLLKTLSEEPLIAAISITMSGLALLYAVSFAPKSPLGARLKTSMRAMPASVGLILGVACLVFGAYLFWELWIGIENGEMQSRRRLTLREESGFFLSVGRQGLLASFFLFAAARVLAARLSAPAGSDR